METQKQNKTKKQNSIRNLLINVCHCDSGKSIHTYNLYATSFTCMRNTCEGEFLGVLIS